MLLGIKKSLSSFAINTDSDLEIIWTACITSSANLLIGSCYRAPNSDHSFPNKLRESITKAFEIFPANIPYLQGDFNFPEINWAQLSSPCTASTRFINLTLHLILFQVVAKHTRGSNILDLILTTAPDTVGKITYLV